MPIIARRLRARLQGRAVRRGGPRRSRKGTQLPVAVARRDGLKSEVLRVAPIAAPVRWRALPDVLGEKQSRRGSSATVEATYAAPNRADVGARSPRGPLRVRVARRETPERSEAAYI